MLDIKVHRPTLTRGQILLVQKRRLHRTSRTTTANRKPQHILPIVNTTPMPLQHIQPKQTLHILIPQPIALHHRNRTRKIIPPNRQIHHVNLAQYLARPNPHGNAGESIVHQVQQPQPIGARAAHNGALRARVDEHLERLLVHEAVHVEHQYATHAFGVFFHHLLVLLLDVLESYFFAKVFVGIGVHGVVLECVSHFDLLGLFEMIS
mmetsp:Transcript_3178/g.5801  ORF Transcript_3178/g.5801 Transcript_3178/m.5801 type:complete len:207 (+) Transcript_3178:229-849(+)